MTLTERVIAQRRILNTAGGILTLLAIALPWRILNGSAFYIFETMQFGAYAYAVSLLIFAGGIISIRSRYGCIATFVGISLYLAILTPLSRPPGYTFSGGIGVGFVLALAGGILSLMGNSGNVPLITRLISETRMRIRKALISDKRELKAE